LDELAPLLAHLEVATEQSGGGGGAQADEDLGTERRQLGVEPRPASGPLPSRRGLVDAHPAAGLPLEVLDDVGEIDPAPIDAGPSQCLVEDAPGGPHERLAGLVLLVAGLLAHQHQLGVGWAVAEDRLGGVPPQVTALAAG